MHTTAPPALEARPISTGGKATEGPRLGRMPALDGVRGVAVLGVVAYHLDHLKGGYLGVDAFFVLSGFLITSLLLVEVEASGRVDLAAFWARRARRLLPALVVVISAVVLVASLVSTPGELASLRGDALASLFYVANWRDIFTDTSYWGMFQAPSPLRHMWSLAIEEQFYLLWPLVFALVAARAGRRARRWIGIVAVSGLAASAVACWLVFDPADPSRAYYGTDTRAAAILLGALAAWVVRRRSAGGALGRRAAVALDVTACLAIVALAVAWVRLPGTSAILYHGGLLACGVAATVVVLACALAPGGVVARLLAFRPLCAVGLVSYGLYLWHWPVIVWLTPARTELDGVWLLILRLAVMAVAVVASYYVVERPIRRGSLAPRQLLVWGGAAAIGCLGLVLVVTSGRSVPPLASSGGEPTPAADAPSRRPPSPAPTAAPSAAPATGAVPTTLAAVGPKPGQLPSAAGTVPPTVAATTPAIPPRVLVVGDSGAWFLGEAMAAEAPRVGAVVMSRGWIGCGVAREGGGVRVGDGPLLRDPDGCADWPTRWQEDLQSFRPDRVLLLLSWPGLGDRKIQGKWRHPCSPEFDAYYRGEVNQALAVLASTGARVYIATAPYFTANGAPAEAAERVDCLNRTYREAAALTGAQILDVEGWVCPDGQCRRDDHGVVLREDGLHFSGGGAVIAADWALDRLGASTT